MRISRNNPQIMNRQPFVICLYHICQIFSQFRSFSIFRNNRIIVDDYRQLIFFLKLPFNVVNQIMGLHIVHLCRKLNVKRSKLIARTVIMHHQIMHAKHLRITHDTLFNLRYQFRIRAFSQKRCQCISKHPIAAVQNKRCHCHCHDAVNSLYMSCRDQKCRDEYCACRKAVISRICRSCPKRIRMNHFCQIPVKMTQPQFYQNRSYQNKNCQPAESDSCRMKDFSDSFHGKIQTDCKNNHTDSQSSQIFISGMPIRMLLIRFFRSKPKSKQTDHAAARITQIVECICCNRHTSKYHTDNKFSKKQQYIADNPDDTGKISHLAAVAPLVLLLITHKPMNHLLCK